MYDESSELLQRFDTTLIRPRNPKEEDSVTKSKKFTAAVAASAVASAMVAPAAFAGTTFSDIDGSYAKDAILKLADAGIITGTGAGQFNPAGQIERQDFAIILAKSLKLDTTTAPAAATFTDVPKDHYAFAAVEAAVKAGLIKGTGNGQFGAGANLSREDLAALFGRALNFVAGKDIIAGKASKLTFSDAANIADYAKDAVGAAFELGYISGDNGKFDPQGTATREQLASMTTRFLDAAAKVGEKEVTYSAKATGAKQLTVSFGTAVDVSKAVVTVKKGSSSVNVAKVTFSEDKTTAVLDLSSRLVKGDYVVTTTGVKTDALTATVTAEDEKLAKIELLSDTAAATVDASRLITGATVAYKASNQYGEDLTKTTTNINWTTGFGTAIDGNDGVVTITYGFQKDQKFTLTGVDATTGTPVTKLLTVGDVATTSTVEFGALYNKKSAELNTKSNYSEFQQLFTAKDQYGNTIDQAKFDADFIVTSSNPSVVGVKSTTTNGLTAPDSAKTYGATNDALGIELVKPTNNIDGTATIRFINRNTGKDFSFDVTVKKAATVETITLSAPDATVASGDGTVTIPFTAVDQNGNDVTDLGTLQEGVTLSDNLAWSYDYVAKKSKIKMTVKDDLTADEATLISAYSKVNGKPSIITVTVKAGANPATITAVKDLKGALVTGATTELSVDNLTVADQYGREVALDSTFFDDTKNNGYAIKVTAEAGTNVTVNGKASELINTATDVLTLAGAAAGSEHFTLSLVKKTGNKDIVNSEIDFNEQVVDIADVKDFAADDVSPIYYDGAVLTGTTGINSWTRGLDVYGKLSDGTKVVLPDNAFTVTSNMSGVTYDDATRTLDAHTYTVGTVDTDINFGDASEKKGTVTVVVVSTGQNISKDVTLSNVAPRPETITNEDAGKVDITSGVAAISATDLAANGLADVIASFTAKDQYGESYTIVPTSVNLSVLKDANVVTGAALAADKNGTTLANVKNAAAGDTFMVTIVTKGKSASIQVVVK